MKTSTTFALRATAAAALLGLASTAFALETSANIELDNTYRTGTATKGGPDEGLSQSGRVELNVTGKVGSKYFVAGKAAILAQKTGGVATDDMWIQLGSEAGDVKLGRFEAADLFPLAQDTVVNDAIGTLYKGNALRGRKGANVFHVAGTLNFAKGVGIELGLIETKNTPDNKGVRPVFFVDSGPLSLKVGVEAGKTVPTGEKLTGFGATAGYDFGGVKITGNLASGKSKLSGFTTKKGTTFGITGQAGPAVLGLIAGTNDYNTGTKEKVTTFYASYSLPLFDIKGATVTPALSASKASNIGGASGVSLKDTSARVRFNYTF
jgi:hypothetical protein